MDLNSLPATLAQIDRALAPPAAGSDWQPDAGAALASYRARRSSSERSRRRWSWAAATTATIVLTVAFFPATRALAARCVDACVGLTSKAARLRPDPGRDAGALLDAARRPVAPAFALPDASGAVVNLADLRGQVVLVNFWATWCAPCAVEMPWFAEFEARYKTAGLTVIGLSLDEDGWKVVRPFAEARHVPYRLALGTDELATAYGGIEALPSTFLIDRQGRVAARRVGLVPKSEYDAQILQLLAER